MQVKINSDTPGSWLIQQSANNAITDNTPTQVSTNQDFVTTLTVVPPVTVVLAN